MPFYDYYCETCGRDFTVRATMQEKEAGLRPRCPLCGSVETKAVIRRGVWFRRPDGKPRPPGSCCGPGSDGGCCG